MKRFRGHRVRAEHIQIGGRAYEVLVPLEGEALLDEPRVIARFDEDEYMPYWADLWPASLHLADALAAIGPVHAHGERPTLLELGCGLGLVGLVAADLGYAVTVSDYDEDALAFAAESFRRNQLPAPEVRRIDWRRRYEGMAFDWIVGADVLYESRNVEPVARFVRAHLRGGGRALISDPHRSTADSFAEVARREGLEVSVVDRERDEARKRVRARVFDLQRASGGDRAEGRS